MYANLKLQIWQSGLRQNRIAQMLGIDEALLSKIVNGYRMPNPRLKTQLAQILRQQEDWLFSTTRVTNPPNEQDQSSDLAGGLPEKTGENT